MKFKVSRAAEAYARAHGHEVCMDSTTSAWCMSVDEYERDHALKESDLQPGAVVNFSRDYTIKTVVLDSDTQMTAREVKEWMNDPNYKGMVTLVSKAPVDPRIAMVQAAGKDAGTMWGEVDAKNILDALIHQGLIK